MSALEPLLQQAGFTDYEARAYIALLQKSPQTGYELAKHSGIPRANIYGVLQKLESRGAAVKVVSPDAVRYNAVSSELVIQRMKGSYLDMMQEIENHMQALTRNIEGEHVESFEGYENLIFYTTDLLQSAREGVVVALHSKEAEQLTPPLAKTTESGIHLKTLCLSGCKEPCQACHGEFHQVSFPYPENPRWFIAVADESMLVAGEISKGQVTGIRTRLPVVVKMTSLFLQQSCLITWLIQSGHLDAELLPEDFALRQGQ